MKGVNKFAQILITERSKVDLKEVLGLSTFSIERSLEMDPSLAASVASRRRVRLVSTSDRLRTDRPTLAARCAASPIIRGIFAKHVA